MKKSVPALNEEGPLRRQSNQADPLVVLERRTESGDDRAFILVNTHEQQTSQIEIEGSSVAVEPFEVRVLRVGTIRSGRPVPQHPRWRPENRIQIEEVYPELDGGRYPVKRIVGELFEVWADLFRDGHDKLRAVVKYRREDEAWREAPLVFYDNDRWVGRFRARCGWPVAVHDRGLDRSFRKLARRGRKEAGGRPEHRSRTRRGAEYRRRRAGAGARWR